MTSATQAPVDAWVILHPHSNTNPSGKYLVVNFRQWAGAYSNQAPQFDSAQFDTYAQAEQARNMANAAVREQDRGRANLVMEARGAGQLDGLLRAAAYVTGTTVGHFYRDGFPNYNEAAQILRRYGVRVVAGRLVTEQGNPLPMEG